MKWKSMSDINYIQPGDILEIGDDHYLFCHRDDNGYADLINVYT